MNYCVVVHTVGKELDNLRGDAYRVARDASTDWYAEPRDLGTAFENANVRTRFWWASMHPKNESGRGRRGGYETKNDTPHGSTADCTRMTTHTSRAASATFSGFGSHQVAGAIFVRGPG